MKLTLVLIVFAFCVLENTYAAPQPAPGFFGKVFDKVTDKSKTKVIDKSHNKVLDNSKNKVINNKDTNKTDKKKKISIFDKLKVKVSNSTKEIGKGIWKEVKITVKNATKEALRDALNEGKKIGIELLDNVRRDALDTLREGGSFDELLDRTANRGKDAWQKVEDKADQAIDNAKNKGFDFVDKITGNLVKKVDSLGGKKVMPSLVQPTTTSKPVSSEESESSEEESLPERVISFTELIKEFNEAVISSLPEVSSDDKRKVLSEVLKVLGGINAATSEFDTLVPTVHTSIAQAIESQTKKILGDWLQWGKDEIEHVRAATNNNGTKIETAKKILLELVNRYTAELANCGNNVVNEVNDFDKVVENAVDTNKAAIENLAQLVQDFVESEKDAGSLQQSAQQISEQLEPLRKSAKEFIILQSNGYALSNTGLTGKVCALSAMAQFDAEKPAVQMKLKDAIQQN